MQGIEHINFTNSPSFAKQVGATSAKAIELATKFTPEEAKTFYVSGKIPEQYAKDAEAQGFDLFALASAIRNFLD